MDSILPQSPLQQKPIEEQAVPVQSIVTQPPISPGPQNSTINQGVVPPVSQIISSPSTPQQTLPFQQQPEAVPSSAQSPEREPIPRGGTNEWAKLSEPEVVLPDEVIEAGVEVVPVTPTISRQQQAAGVNFANEATPVLTEPSEEFHFPFTLPQTEEIIHRDKDISDSLRWLATLIFREIAIARRKKQQIKTTV